MLPATTDVLIAGGGPCGLVLAIELGRRGIAVVLVDQDAGTTHNAAANATQARTMEHFRRLGFADEIRALGLPPQFPTDVAYFTRFARHELARFALAWTAGHSLVAESFSRKRVFIGGDAAHLFTPTGGLGYNTAVEDAVNLGWKIAAVLKGWAASALLGTYEAERRPLAVRNTGYAKGFADSLGNYVPSSEIEDDTAAGAAARRRASEYFAAHGRAEFNIPGITFGGRYDGSPAIVSDATAPPPDKANEYIPTACPGGRPPHLWMPDGRSLYDLLGFEWTLLRLGKGKSPMPPQSPMLKVLELDSEEARELYAADLVLIRPDQIVAWRSNSDARLDAIMRKLCGFLPGVPDSANLA